MDYGIEKLMTDQREENKGLMQVAQRHQASPFQILLAWCLRGGGVLAIPKASSPVHVKANAGAARIRLTDEDLQLLDDWFPAPQRKVPLDVI